MKYAITISAYLILLGSIFYIFSAESKAWRYIQRDVTVIIPAINEPALMFSFESVSDWALDYHGQAEAKSWSRGLINSNTENISRSAVAGISTVSSGYTDIAFMSFLSGGTWQAGNNVILSEHLAWTLFGGTDVSGLTVEIDDVIYYIAGVVEDMAETETDGFAWIVNQNNLKLANIIYLRPYNYDIISAYRDAEAFIADMERNPRNYIITDINLYVQSMALRGYILSALAVFLLVVKIARCLYDYVYLVNTGSKFKRNLYFTALACFAAASGGLAFLIIRQLSIDFWLPAFMGQGIEGYSRLIFNIGLLAPMQYLPGDLAALLELNMRVNSAFWVAFFVVIVLALFSWGRLKTVKLVYL